MLEEFELETVDIVETLKVLTKEIKTRIRTGDGDIDALERVAEALGAADRINIK